jgi:hypothetical protein
VHRTAARRRPAIRAASSRVDSAAPRTIARCATCSAPSSGSRTSSPPRPLADLHLAILRALDVGVATFGDDGTQPLDGL